MKQLWSSRYNSSHSVTAQLPHLVFTAHVNHQVFLFQQPAGIADVDSCLRLVTSQHPHLDPRLPQSYDCVWDVFLQTVLDACRTYSRTHVYSHTNVQ